MNRLIRTYVIGILIFQYQCLAAVEQEDKQIDENRTKTIDDLLDGYNKYVEPPNEKPLVVKLQFYVLGFSEFSDKNMDFTLSYSIRMKWRDDRLSFSSETFGSVAYINLHPDEMHKIWIPDLFYMNEEGESISKPFSVSNSASRIYASGDVLFFRKLETKFRCQMKLQNYPFDTQMCHMEISSYAFTADLLRVEFYSSPLEFFKDVDLMSTFQLLKMETEESILTLNDGNYQHVTIVFKLKRLINFHILQVNIF